MNKTFAAVIATVMVSAVVGYFLDSATGFDKLFDSDFLNWPRMIHDARQVVTGGIIGVILFQKWDS